MVLWFFCSCNKCELKFLCFFFPPSLKKKSSTTSVPSSLQMLAKRKRGRGWEMKTQFFPLLQRVHLCHRTMVKIQTIKGQRMNGPTPKPPPHPTRTSLPRWRGSGHLNLASAIAHDWEGSDGRQLGVWDPAVPAPLSHRWPHGNYWDRSLHLWRGVVGPAPTPTAICCLTVRCANPLDLLLLLSQV